MEKKRQPVHEGYLLWLPASTGGLQTQYCQLSWSCQLRMYPTETAAASGVGGRPYTVRGFCKWEGRGVLPLDSYGVELQVKDKSQTSSIYLAAENRLDLDRWCRALVAVLDPTSAAADEIKRERRKVKRDIRKQAEKEAELKAQEEEFKRKWIAQKKQELRDRELEIEQMTPLQRKDGLGTLDEETEALLRDRKKRLNKKAGQQVGRVGKQVLRRRMELLGGGKVVVLTDPSDATFGEVAAASAVVQRKTKVKVELPPPGQFFTGDETSRGSQHAGSASASGRQSTTSSQESAASTDDGTFAPPPPPSPPSTRGESFRSSQRGGGGRGSGPPPPPPPPPASSSTAANRPFNPMAGALEAIKRNRKFSEASDRTSGIGLQAGGSDDEPDAAAPAITRARSARTRDSQLSAEGKRMLARALSHHTSGSSKPAAHNPTDRKGLFDSSSSDDDAESAPGNDLADTSPFMTAPTAAIPAVLSVVHLSAVVEVRQGKSVAIYRFAFRLAPTSLQVEFGFSYHEFDAIHGDLKRTVAVDLPKFPSKHVLRNPTKPDNMQKRAAEFLAYFQALVQLRPVVAHPAFHAAFGVPSDMAAILVRGTVAQDTPPATRTTAGGVASSRKTHHPPVHKAMPTLPKPPKRNLFEEDDDDEDDDDDQASVASSVEAPEPMHRVPTDRPRAASNSSSRLSLEERPKRETRPPSTSKPDRPPSTKEVKVTGLPPRPNLFGGGRGDLLAAIRQGATLNRVGSPDAADPPAPSAPRPSAPVPPTNSLLAALQKAPPLRKTTDQPAAKPSAPPPAPPLTAPSIHDSIAIAMASRQMHTQFGHSDDDSSADEWDD